MPQNGDIKARAVVTHEQTWSLAIETELAGRPGQRLIEPPPARIPPTLPPSSSHRRSIQIRSLPMRLRPSRCLRRLPCKPVSRLQGSPDPWSTLWTSCSRQLWDLAFRRRGPGRRGRSGRAALARGTARYVRLRRDQKAMAAAPAGAYGQFDFTAATLAACFNLGRRSPGSPAFGPCADYELGVMSARGFLVTEGLPGQTLWSALGAGAYAAIPLGRHLSLPLHVDVLAPLRRTEFVFKNEPGRVFQAPAVGVRIGLGVELHF